jgi:methionyl aminopeptidase
LDTIFGNRLAKAIDLGKKKRRRRPKKKNRTATAVLKQYSSPRVLLSDLFPIGVYPPGEIAEYNRDENTSRTTGEEIHHLDRMDDKFINDYHQAAEVHCQVRQWTQMNVKPGQTLTEIAEDIENGVRALTGHQGLEPGDSLRAGMGFPTGLSLNNCPAHYTPSAGTEIVLKREDVMKVDFGVHVNGRIVDSAFTMAFNPAYDKCLLVTGQMGRQ